MAGFSLRRMTMYPMSMIANMMAGPMPAIHGLLTVRQARHAAKSRWVKKNFELPLKACERRDNKPLPKIIDELKRLVSKNEDLLV